MSIEHLQTESPVLTFEDWLFQVVTLFSEAWKIDKPSAFARLNVDELESWYKDGFAPYVTFRETYQPLY
jgi:hypothetical protein